jgi:hypothetical protein
MANATPVNQENSVGVEQEVANTTTMEDEVVAVEEAPVEVSNQLPEEIPAVV